jgi:hypothetical protein
MLSSAWCTHNRIEVREKPSPREAISPKERLFPSTGPRCHGDGGFNYPTWPDGWDLSRKVTPAKCAGQTRARGRVVKVGPTDHGCCHPLPTACRHTSRSSEVTTAVQGQTAEGPDRL